MQVIDKCDKNQDEEFESNDVEKNVSSNSHLVFLIRILK